MSALSCGICKEIFKQDLDQEIYACPHLSILRHLFCSCVECLIDEKGIKITPNFRDIESVSQDQTLLVSENKDLKKNLADSTNKFKQQINSYEGRMKELKKRNANLEKAIERKTIENDSLQEALNAATSIDQEQTSTIMQEENNVLNEKLKQISLELKKEIRNSTELTIDKMKLQSMLEKATSSLKTAKENKENANELKKTEELETVEYISMRQAMKRNGCPQSVVIKNVKGAFFNSYCVMDYIGKLMRHMNVNMNTSDVEKVSVLEGKRCGELSLIVKLKTQCSKVMFLSKSSRLRMFEDTQNLVLHEFVDDQTNSLFHEAKSLRAMGYKYVYCRNNKVMVKKDEKSVAIVIGKTEDIDELKTKDNENGQSKGSECSLKLNIP